MSFGSYLCHVVPKMSCIIGFFMCRITFVKLGMTNNTLNNAAAEVMHVHVAGEVYSSVATIFTLELQSIRGLFNIYSRFCRV